VRADRLVAALLLMQSRGRVTATELASQLEVSVATARRDLEALSAAGIPVYPQPGRGGGWSLGDGRTRVRIAAPTPLGIARNLAGWGAMIEVIEPRTVQAELARIGAELADQYSLPEEESADQQIARPAKGRLTGT
jgi:predicted DNA-binding transcriptional regulator YafY